jgi:hypothetical protein
MVTQRDKIEHARVRALVRFNGVAFRSLAAASFLETAVPGHVNRLTQVFGAHADVGLWLEQVWWPQRAELGRQLREYLEATWPEFDWNVAYDEYYESNHARSGLESGDGGPAIEALRLCVATAQAALFYRALASSADEPALRALARKAARNHAGFFDYFRALFERCKQFERVGITATWRTIVDVSRCARDHDVAIALSSLDRNWNGSSIVPELGYSEYRERMAQLIKRHAALGPVERLLFHPWFERIRAAPAPQQPSARPGQRLQLAPQPA